MGYVINYFLGFQFHVLKNVMKIELSRASEYLLIPGDVAWVHHSQVIGWRRSLPLVLASPPILWDPIENLVTVCSLP